MGIARGNSSASSSSPSEGDVARVIRAFEQSPVTTGKAKATDDRKARELLDHYTVEQIECGILLGSMRRGATDPELRAKVHNLAYFTNPIAEAAEDKLTPFHAQLFRNTLNRILRGELGSRRDQ